MIKWYDNGGKKAHDNYRFRELFPPNVDIVLVAKWSGGVRHKVY